MEGHVARIHTGTGPAERPVSCRWIPLDLPATASTLMYPISHHTCSRIQTQEKYTQKTEYIFTRLTVSSERA